MSETLIIFAKNECYGKVKTRLAATIGHQKALTIYRKLVSHTSEITRPLAVRKIVFYSDYIETKDAWNGSQFEKKLQIGEDLGDRMSNAFGTVFEEGTSAAVIIGTDCLELSSEIISNGLGYLQQHDIVIGPAKDGGYYLLGMKRLHADLFRHIQWSTGLVLGQTLATCTKLNLSVYTLPSLSDIDTEEDLNKAVVHQSFLSYD